MKDEARSHAANVLVTGGAGYIGSHTCKALAAAGYTPIAYDNLVNGHMSAVRWGPFEHGDILDRGRLDEVITKYRPRTIIHFAAFAYVGESVSDPGKYYRNNVVGSLTLIQAAQDHGVRNIVYSSSCAIFGIPATVPITEDMPKEPISPYGMSKLIVERMLHDFQRSQGLNWIALRYFNAAGCDPAGEIGEVHNPEPHIIPLALEAAAGARRRLTILGADYATPDGTCIRDYVHVSDLADAHIKALKALEDGVTSGQFNLGSGKGFSVREVVETVRQVTKLDFPVDIGPRREGDPPILVSDAAHAHRVLGWNPAIPDLTDIVRTAWNWYRSRQSVEARGTMASD
jgi:UDP-arabinose 4-epimerase